MVCPGGGGYLGGALVMGKETIVNHHGSFLPGSSAIGNEGLEGGCSLVQMSEMKIAAGMKVAAGI